MYDDIQIDSLPSYSLQNSFISTLDHLPCDIIRSLWLIQTCNIKIDKSKQQLQAILDSYIESKQISNLNLQLLVNLKSKINHLTNETIQESKALNNQLITHKLNLNDEINLLHQINSKKQNLNVNNDSHRELRTQLESHYKDHPLQSQREAIEEQKQLDSRNNNKSGLKLILKLPKNDTIIKPKHHHVVKKDDKIKKKLIKKESRAPVKKVSRIEEIMEEVEEEVEDDEDKKLYCFCKQPSSGDMIACDNEDSCPNGDWFHYKCVGLLNRVDALKYTTGKNKWFCSRHCKTIVEEKDAMTKDKKRKKRRRKW